MRITLHIATKDRHTEVTLLLQSLRTQTYQDFDIIIVDDGSGTPLQNCEFFLKMMNRLKLEGHKIKVARRDRSDGVCHARNTAIEYDDFDNPLTFRCDDDVILEPDYIGRLVNVIKKGYDMATGIVPLLMLPVTKREVKFIKKIVCLHEFDKEGNIKTRNDELGYGYDEKVILLCDQFRTNCLYHSVINKTVKYPLHLTPVGFREELWFSFQAIIQGYKIAADTGAIAYHLQTNSGGCRRTDYAQCIQLDEYATNKWIKEMWEKHGDFLMKYHKQILK